MNRSDEHGVEALPPDVDVLVIGAGQAGLGVAHRLRQHAALRTLVVDELPVGQSWRERRDSLQLFTPRRFSSLPGLRFPAGSPAARTASAPGRPRAT